MNAIIKNGTCGAAVSPVVFIVDDDSAVRDALIRIVYSVGHHSRGFPSGAEFLNSRCYLEPGCAVLDVKLPDYDGMQLYNELQRSGARAMHYALGERFGQGFDDHLHYPERIRAVTAADVQRVARAYLARDRLIEVTVGSI